MTDEPGARTPALGRLELAAALRRHRKSARLSTQDVTAQLGISASKLSRLETGKRSVSLDDLDALIGLYAVAADEQIYLRRLSDESRQTSLWRSLDAFNFNSAEYLELEEGASAIDDYKTSVVTALLQTPEYTRALINGLAPGRPGDIVEGQVEARQLRLRNLWGRRQLPRLTFVLDEAVLHRQVGGAAIMRNQLQHLQAISDRDNVDLHILPFEIGAHIGMDSLFTILSFQEPVRDRVYVDSLKGKDYVTDPDELQRFRSAFNRLVEVGLDAESSKKLIGDLMDEL